MSRGNESPKDHADLRLGVPLDAMAETVADPRTCEGAFASRRNRSGFGTLAGPPGAALRPAEHEGVRRSRSDGSSTAKDFFFRCFAEPSRRSSSPLISRERMNLSWTPRPSRRTCLRLAHGFVRVRGRVQVDPQGQIPSVEASLQFVDVCPSIACFFFHISSVCDACGHASLRWNPDLAGFCPGSQLARNSTNQSSLERHALSRGSVRRSLP